MLQRTMGFAVGVVWFGLFAGTGATAAEYTTRNFQVSAPTPEIARKVGETAEFFRREIAQEWLGYELPRWSARCPIRVKVGQIGAGGQTTFNFHPSANGPDEVCDWKMEVQGSLERILDSVIPHEVSHTIFACHFRRPLPRWADEGAATLVECDSERRIQVLTVEETINTRRRIPLKQLLAMKEYPRDQSALRVLYAEGYSLANLLVQEGGKQRYLRFLEDAHRNGWDAAIDRHYPYAGIDALEQRWRQWVVAGSPEIERAPRTLLAENQNPPGPIRKPDDAPPILRGQSPATEPSSPRRSRPAGKDRTQDELADARRLSAPPPARRSRGAELGEDDQSIVAASPAKGRARIAGDARELPRRVPNSELSAQEPAKPPRNSGRELAASVSGPPRRNSAAPLAGSRKADAADLSEEDLDLQGDADCEVRATRLGEWEEGDADDDDASFRSEDREFEVQTVPTQTVPNRPLPNRPLPGRPGSSRPKAQVPPAADKPKAPGRSKNPPPASRGELLAGGRVSDTIRRTNYSEFPDDARPLLGQPR